MSETFEMVAKTLYGLEEILAGELLSLGASGVISVLANVIFRCQRHTDWPPDGVLYRR
jgi:dihydrodipicolinate synthase/N-acetylneuraminate lyase